MKKMQLKETILFVCLFVIITVNGTQVQKCKEGATKQLESDEVAISHCTKPTCKLRRKTTVDIEMKVNPDQDVDNLTTSVRAEIFGIPLPFIGVDGTSACDNIFALDGETKVGCPLKKGESYVYKNSFKILEIYPRVNLVVRWALNTGKNDITCFEVPAKIV